MNYRHIYHAGNFADIVKHITLISVIEELLKKPKPFTVLDAFAGIGRYDLESIEALKTRESGDGVGRFLDTSSDITPLLVQKFLKLACGSPRYYLGSPMIVAQMLREQDRLIACELHPEDHRVLRRNLSNFASAGVHHTDAYNAIKAFLPFDSGRGLVLIDPPFEITNEFNKIENSLQLIKKRSPNICIMIWYPIKDRMAVKNWYSALNYIGFKEILCIESIVTNPTDIQGLRECGVVIINPHNISKVLAESFSYVYTKTGIKSNVVLLF